MLPSCLDPVGVLTGLLAYWRAADLVRIPNLTDLVDVPLAAEAESGRKRERPEES
jgi:hypothetical protein